MKEFVSTNILATIRYHDLAGSDAPILFIHGLGCASSLDYPQVATQSVLQNHRRILIDLLGSGYSDKPLDFPYTIASHVEYLVDFVDFLEFPQIVLYGHSMGGSIAISLAAKLGSRASALVVSEANLDSGGGFFSRKMAAFGEANYIARGHAETIREGLELSNGQWAASLAVSLPESAYRQAQSLVDGQSPTWREQLYALGIPKTFIFGEQSLPDPDYQRLLEAGVRVEIVPNAGHGMALENPGGLAAVIAKAVRN